MSPLPSQSTTFAESQSTEELNSELFWFDSDVNSPFHEQPFRLFEVAATTFDGPPTVPTDLLASFEDEQFDPPPAQSGDWEQAEFANFAAGVANIPFSVRYEDLYASFSLLAYPSTTVTDCSSFDPTYQTIHQELFHNDHTTCVPADLMTVYEASSSVPATTFTHTPFTSLIHSVATPVNPSTMTSYEPDSSCSPQVPLSDNAAATSLPPTSPPDFFDNTATDNDGDRVPLSDEEEEYHPTQSTSGGKREITAGSPCSVTSSPTRSTSSKSEKNGTPSRKTGRSQPYMRDIPSRNFQYEDSTLFINQESEFGCPVPGCEYVQKNQRAPDLKRHIVTHGRWREPEKWICCGVEMDKAHLYGKDVKQEMTDEECLKAGAYKFRGRLMIGGCMKTFARRDALKRHVDNPKIPCVGHMNSYS